MGDDPLDPSKCEPSTGFTTSYYKLDDPLYYEKDGI